MWPFQAITIQRSLPHILQATTTEQHATGESLKKHLRRLSYIPHNPLAATWTQISTPKTECCIPTIQPDIAYGSRLDAYCLLLNAPILPQCGLFTIRISTAYLHTQNSTQFSSPWTTCSPNSDQHTQDWILHTLKSEPPVVNSAYPQFNQILLMACGSLFAA